MTVESYGEYSYAVFTHIGYIYDYLYGLHSVQSLVNFYLDSHNHQHSIVTVVPVAIKVKSMIRMGIYPHPRTMQAYYARLEASRSHLASDSEIDLYVPLQQKVCSIILT
jgi:hypothetical protein